MLKYLLAITILCGLTLFVARQDERATQESAQKASQLNNGAVAAETDKEHPKENIQDADRNTPGWYGFFRWPNGTTTWAIILTLLAIAEQTSETAKAAKATRDSVGHIERQAGIMEAQLAEMKQSRAIETKTLLLQYRPKIIVRDARASDFNVAELGNPAQGKVQLTLVNTGGTPANILGGWIALWSAQSSVSVPLEIKQGEEAQFSALTLQPGERETLERELDTGTTNDIQWANFHQAIKTDPLKYIYLVGKLVYRDDLGIPRQTGIHRVYDPKTKTFTPGNSDGEYAD
jgi:hypothetical protein